VAKVATQIETENNALMLIPIALELIDKGITAYDAWQLEKAIKEGRTDDAEEIAAGIAIGLATEAVPGNQILRKIGTALGKRGDAVVQGAENVLARNDAIAADLAKRSDVSQVKQVSAGSKGNWPKTTNGKLEPNTGYVLDNGHAYVTDAAGKVKEVSGELSLTKMDRNGHQQCTTGKCGNAGDEGGHLIASALGGAGDRINLVPQAGTLNQGAWKNMEKQFMDALDAKKTVSVKIDVGYPAGGGTRPNLFTVVATIDGKSKSFEFHQ
jgi:hypothetical protein